MPQLHFGLHAQLEEAATELIRKSLEGVTSMSEKSDILTPWKEMDRRRREVYTAEGIPDGSVRRGMYHRAWNSHRPNLNSIEGKARLRADRLDGPTAPRFAPHDPDAVAIGEVYDLRVQWGNQKRIKCPGCSKYCKPVLEIRCRCGSVLSQMPDDGHYLIARLA